jgi:hypothetical protein
MLSSRSRTRTRTRRAALLAAVITALAAASALAETAGRVTALVPAALRNRVATRAQEALEWNDQLATDQAGRLRAGLADGSVLSLGAASELRVVKHDAASQQTELELAYGKLRSMVTPLRGAGRSFDVKTPAANVGVIGTDFFLDAAAGGSLRVLCFSGAVEVRASAGAAKSYRVEAGQTLELDAHGAGTVRRATESEVRGALDATAIPGVLDLAPRTRLTASLTRTLDESKTKAGTPVTARVTREVRIAGAVVVPKGAELLGTVTQAQKRDATHTMAEIAVTFQRLRLPDGREFAFRSVIDGFEVAKGLEVDESASADTSFGESRADRTQSRPPTGLAAPRIPVARPSSGPLPPGVARLPERGADDLGDPVPALALSLPVVQPRLDERDSGAVFKTSQGLHIASGTVLAMRTLEPELASGK